jgi:mRNA-degrading endonuclease RelE of RelBE toxin-antitoxin system
MSDKRTILFSDEFLRNLKDLRKKYRHIEDDVEDFAQSIKNGETPGDRLQGTGDYVMYKARVASRDMQRGKSGGFRVIYYLQTEDKTIAITIYAKTERADISTADLMELIEDVLKSLDDAEDEVPPAE